MMYATAADLMSWSRSLHAGELLSSEWRERLRDPYTDGPPPRHAYALDHVMVCRPDAEAVPATIGREDESRVARVAAEGLRDRMRRLRQALQDGEWDRAREIMADARAENPVALPLPARVVGPLVEEPEDPQD